MRSPGTTSSVRLGGLSAGCSRQCGRCQAAPSRRGQCLRKSTDWPSSGASAKYCGSQPLVPSTSSPAELLRSRAHAPQQWMPPRLPILSRPSLSKATAAASQTPVRGRPPRPPLALQVPANVSQTIRLMRLLLHVLSPRRRMPSRSLSMATASRHRPPPPTPPPPSSTTTTKRRRSRIRHRRCTAVVAERHRRLPSAATLRWRPTCGRAPTALQRRSVRRGARGATSGGGSAWRSSWSRSSARRPTRPSPGPRRRPWPTSTWRAMRSHTGRHMSSFVGRRSRRRSRSTTARTFLGVKSQ
mmetsp:Transcript_25483/g.71735  ORF Transcript_25483/g.71735 Transcript_25483/m.71735 type:complete len:299 (-) Transcript_25483:117-1013(-)